jgi:hypothetical protein
MLRSSDSLPVGPWRASTTTTATTSTTVVTTTTVAMSLASATQWRAPAQDERSQRQQVDWPRAETLVRVLGCVDQGLRSERSWRCERRPPAARPSRFPCRFVANGRKSSTRAPAWWSATSGIRCTWAMPGSPASMPGPPPRGAAQDGGGGRGPIGSRDERVADRRLVTARALTLGLGFGDWRTASRSTGSSSGGTSSRTWKRTRRSTDYSAICSETASSRPRQPR